jgi:hypothetical protein
MLIKLGEFRDRAGKALAQRRYAGVLHSTGNFTTYL